MRIYVSIPSIFALSPSPVRVPSRTQATWVVFGLSGITVSEEYEFITLVVGRRDNKPQVQSRKLRAHALNPKYTEREQLEVVCVFKRLKPATRNRLPRIGLTPELPQRALTTGDKVLKYMTLGLLFHSKNHRGRRSFLAS